MKRIPAFMVLAAFATVASVRSQEDQSIVPPEPAAPPAASPATGIIGHLADGSPSLPAPKIALPPFQVQSTVVRLIDVVEPPPLPGLPPVTGTITQTVQLVADPGLPDPHPPAPVMPRDNFAGIPQTRVGMQTVSLSATVYDHCRTFVRWNPSEKLGDEVTGWSNLDFNHFSGLFHYQVKGRDGEVRQYVLMMGIDNTDTLRTSESFQRAGKTYHAPEHPELPDLATNGPAFVFTEGDTADDERRYAIEDMHELYRVEGARMAAAYQARIKAYEERKAFLLAHPPKPADVNVSFWKRDHPLRQPLSTETEGGGQ